MNASIQLSNGLYFDFLDPDPDVLDIWTIANALAKICRFTGQLPGDAIYSVAQHSVIVSYLVPPEDAMYGLMHDAAEALVGDVAAPLKQLLPAYKEIEHRAEYAVAVAFDLPTALPPTVKRADLVALATEKRDLMPSHPEPWPCLDGIQPHAGYIDPWQPSYAAIHYHARLLQLLSTTHRQRVA